jgi:hypothetical protein
MKEHYCFQSSRKSLIQQVLRRLGTEQHNLQISRRS